MSVSSHYLAYVLEQLAALERISSRRMFGGVGLYCADVFFAIIDSDALYFRVDDSTRGDYEARGMPPFRPYRDRPDVSLTYYEVPADALEDAAELTAWARRSLAAARSAKARRARGPRPASRRLKS